MGYYTEYTMSLLDPATQEILSESKNQAVMDKVIQLLREKNIINYALDENLDCHEAVTWYEYDDDIKALSKQIPDVLFCVHGAGENHDDLWDHYFLNGKSQRCDAEIKIPPYNPDLLE